MNALYFQEHGSIEQLRYGDIEDPRCRANEAIIRVRACALNHLDIWVLRGWPGLKLQMPHVGGADIAGEIAALGSNVERWKVGDRVVIEPGFVSGEDEWTRRGEDSVSPHYHVIGEGCRGGFAEYVAVPATSLHPFPQGFTFSSAAAPLLVGLTAWRMLRERAQLTRGESVLIVGAGGGVNSFAIQLARYIGAEVIALSSSDEKLDKATALGANHVINYRRYPDWSRIVKRLTNNRGVDVVIDNVGAKTFEQSIRSVVRGGRIVTVGNTSGPTLSVDNRLIFTKQISIIGSTMGSANDFREAMDVVWSGGVKPVIDSEIPLKEGKVAYRMLERGQQFGKLVLIPG